MYVRMYVCMYACVYVYIYICFTRWLSTDVFHSWSLRYAFDFFVPVLTCATGSDIFSTNHMFPNPVVPFTYPPTSLSLKLKNSFPENVFLEGSTFRLYRSAHVHSWQFLKRTCFNDASIRLDTLVHRYKKSQRRGFVECPAFWTKKRNRPAKTLSRRSTLC